MQAAEPGELGSLEAGDHAEDAHLFGVLQLGLEADHVPERAECVVLPELHHGIGPASGSRIVEPDRFHRPVAQCLAPALGHDLDRQAAVEIRRRGFPLLEHGLVAGKECIDEGRVLRLVHRAVEIIGAGARGTRLAVARLEPGNGRIDTVAMDHRRDGIEEGERTFTCQFGNRPAQGRRGEGARRDDDTAPGLGRQAGDFTAIDRDQRVRLEARRDVLRKAVAIDGKCAACRKLVLVAGTHDEGRGAPHLLVQQSDGVVLPIIGTE